MLCWQQFEVLFSFDHLFIDENDSCQPYSSLMPSIQKDAFQDEMLHRLEFSLLKPSVVFTETCPIMSRRYAHVFRKNNRKLSLPHFKRTGKQLRDFSFMLKSSPFFVVNLYEVTKYVRGEGGYLVM